MPAFQPEINAELADDFFEGRFLTGDGTWFKRVELLQYGAVLTWELDTRRHRIWRYWSLDSVGSHLIESVRRHCGAHEDVGVSLSGGVESRAILAAAPDHGTPIATLTFRTVGCADLRIARRAARVKGARHIFFELSETHWLAPRVEGVWFSVSRAGVVGTLETHMAGTNRSELLCRYPAFELFLQQIFNERYRQSPEWISSREASA